MSKLYSIKRVFKWYWSWNNQPCIFTCTLRGTRLVANKFFFLIFDRTIISENNRIELFYNIQKVIEMILGRDVYYYSVNKNRNMGTRNLHIHVPRSRSTRLYSFFFLFLSFLFYFTSSRIRYESNWHAPDAGNDDEPTSMPVYLLWFCLLSVYIFKCGNTM